MIWLDVFRETSVRALSLPAGIGKICNSKTGSCDLHRYVPISSPLHLTITLEALGTSTFQLVGVHALNSFLIQPEVTSSEKEPPIS